jgi:integrase/recombinase XerC
MTPEAGGAVGRFLQHLSGERRLSDHTASNYRRDLDALIAWCSAQGLARWSDVDSQHIRQFAARSHASGLDPRSVQRRLSAVRSLFRFLIREGEVTHNPGTDVRAPKTTRRLPTVLDADQVASLLESNAVATALQRRDRAMMELFYSSGLRLAELVNLNLTDVDPRDRTVRVLGKGRKSRIVPVGRKALEALESWRIARAELVRDATESALFIGRGGRRIGPRAVQLRVAASARAAGLGVPVHPHLFRHSFASHLLESSQDLRAVQELLGHADIGTTQVYTHLDFQHLARIYDQAHPRARRKSRS